MPWDTVAQVKNGTTGTFPIFATPCDSRSLTIPTANESQTRANIGIMQVFTSLFYRSARAQGTGRMRRWRSRRRTSAAGIA
ncbi:hypothetical protein CJU94_11990 [Paraburkholderia aromaticivorans]|uniref:Uncharacterized protein n=1 Tax=Paraburkholderia aromaticivorans TaxID=2026199 RepID=A0A248VIY4_9BURK|nr:hypothetical protein CJU94_11990 [Paraburkholderia aromaticivorans]